MRALGFRRGLFRVARGGTLVGGPDEGVLDDHASDRVDLVALVVVIDLVIGDPVNCLVRKPRTMILEVGGRNLSYQVIRRSEMPGDRAHLVP
jgi:hypothetical protein